MPWKRSRLAIGAHSFGRGWMLSLKLRRIQCISCPASYFEIKAPGFHGLGKAERKQRGSFFGNVPRRYELWEHNPVINDGMGSKRGHD